MVVIMMIIVMMVMIMIMIMIMPMVVVLLAVFFSMFLVPDLTGTFFLVAQVLLVPLVLVRAHVTRLVFGRSHEINPSVAGMVFVTVHAPLPRMFGRNVQVKRLSNHDMWGGGLNDHRCGINQRWRRSAAQIHSTVHTWSNLTVDGYRQVHVGLRGHRGAQTQCRKRTQAKGCFHDIPFSQ
jgi:hypothetical protein